MIHDPHASRKHGRFVHVVRREDERHARLAQLAEAIPDEEARGGIETRRRLVEEEHPRCVHERARDHHSLRLPAGEEIRLVPRAVEQAELLEQLVGALNALSRRHAVVGGMEDEVVPDRDRAVEIAPLRDDGDLLSRADRIPDDVHPTHQRLATGWPDAGRQHPDRRGLPRSVWTEQPEHLAGRDGEGDAVDGVHPRLRIPLGEIDRLGCGAF